MSRAFTSLVAVVVLACGDDGGPGETSFGGATSSDGSTTSTTSSSSSDPSASTSTATPETTSTSGDPGSTGAATTDPTSGGGPSSEGGEDTTLDTSGGSSPLSECLSVDIWESCAQYCENAKDSACQESGCSGATVHYYDSGGECSTMSNGNPSDQACGDPLQSDGGTSFARCCCG
jgi:hypothetical protein